MENKPWLDRFIEENGWLENTPERNLMYLTEEVGEFAREVRRNEVGRHEHLDEIMTKEEMKTKLKEEAGDIIAALYTILKQYDINGITEAIEAFKEKEEEKIEIALINL